MPDISEAWSCPYCVATFTRDRGQSIPAWQTAVHVIQTAHGRQCRQDRTERKAA